MKKASFCICFSAVLSLFVLYPCFGEEYFVLGKEQGDGELIFPRQVEEGPDGNIYVYDQSDAYIKVYSPEGKYLRRIGGSGQGPGEIQRASGVSLGFTPSGKLFFTEFIGGHRWITFMELSGEFYKVLKLEINEVFGIIDSFFLKDGGFLVEVSYMSFPEKKKDFFLYRTPHALIMFNSKGQIISEIIKTNHITRISYISDGADLELPFIPVFEWIPFEKNTVIFTDGLSKNLRVYDHKGTLIREIRTLLPSPEKVTSEDLKRWREERKEMIRDKAWYERFGTVIEKYKKSIYEKIPILSGISLTPEGNILVSGHWNSENNMIDSWLLGKNGKEMAKIALEALVLNVSKHFIFLSIENEDGIIHVYCVKRRGSEEEDLLKLRGLEFLGHHQSYAEQRQHP
ncbi:MAG: hypothetical protein ACETWK_12850 [Candidatus Aminicenantaceae bacterium]